MRWLLFFPLGLFAGFIGDPASPVLPSSGIVHLTTGYLWDYTKSLVLEPQRGSLADPKTSLKDMQLHLQMASASLSLLDRLEFLVLLGGAKEKAMSTKEALFSFEFDSSYHFCWQLKTRLVLFQSSLFAIGVEGSYFDLPSAPNSFFRFFKQLPFSNEKQSFHIKQWQMGAGASLSLFFLRPYAGLHYLRSHLHIEKGTEVRAMNYENPKKLGYYYGIGVFLSERFQLGLERRLSNESGYTFYSKAVF